jgi:hypothetical protein
MLAPLRTKGRSQDFLLRLGLNPQTEVLDLKTARPMPRLWSAGTSGGFGQVARRTR